MNLILVDNKEVKGGEVILTDYRHIHIRDILKPKIGQILKVGIIDGKIGVGEVITQTSKETVLKIDTNKLPPRPLDICLVCSLPRPKTLKKVIYKATSLGVKEIHFINSAKVEKEYWGFKKSKFDQTILDALSQSVDTVLPKISYHRLFRPFVEDILPSLIKDKIVFAHPGGLIPSKAKHTVLIIGPEGGFNAFEISLLSKIAQKITLGKRILRVEDAILTAIGMLS
jgi:16S rRNA (uracil1498-N3)-methyltransferase